MWKVIASFTGVLLEIHGTHVYRHRRSNNKLYKTQNLFLYSTREKLFQGNMINDVKKMSMRLLFTKNK